MQCTARKNIRFQGFRLFVISFDICFVPSYDTKQISNLDETARGTHTFINIVQSIVRSNRNSWAKRLKVVHWHIALIRRRQRNRLRVLMGFGPYHFEVLYRYSISQNFVLIHKFENNQFDVEINMSITFSNNRILVTFSMYIGSFFCYFITVIFQTKIK